MQTGTLRNCTCRSLSYEMDASHRACDPVPCVLIWRKTWLSFDSSFMYRLRRDFKGDYCDLEEYQGVKKLLRTGCHCILFVVSSAVQRRVHNARARRRACSRAEFKSRCPWISGAPRIAQVRLWYITTKYSTGAMVPRNVVPSSSSWPHVAQDTQRICDCG